MPEFEIIAKMELYAKGFENASALAKKFIAVFKATQMTLSRQDHYDFGMRALMTVTKAAGKLKALAPSDDEEIIMLKALKHIYYRLTPKCEPIFEKILKSYFPSFKSQMLFDDNEQEDKITEEFQKMGLTPTQRQISRACGMRKVIDIKHSMIVLGPSMSGKTTMIQAVANMIGNVDVATIFTKDVSHDEFYGWYDQDKKWHDGVFSNQLKQFNLAQDGRLKWIVLNGPIDALFVENLNSVMD